MGLSNDSWYFYLLNVNLFSAGGQARGGGRRDRGAGVRAAYAQRDLRGIWPRASGRRSPSHRAFTRYVPTCDHRFLTRHLS